MHKYFYIFFFLFSSSLLQAQEVEMTTSEIATFKEQVRIASETTTTIVSDFVQYKHLDFLDSAIETSGKLVFKTPGLVKWEYTKPYQYSVIFKEDELLINDGGTKSNVDIGSSRLFRKLNQLIVSSVKGDMFDDAEFVISYFKINDSYKAVFIPKDKKITRYIAAFELLFNTTDAAVKEVKMKESTTDFTRIVFENRVLNSKVDDAVFRN